MAEKQYSSNGNSRVSSEVGRKINKSSNGRRNYQASFALRSSERILRMKSAQPSKRKVPEHLNVIKSVRFFGDNTVGFHKNLKKRIPLGIGTNQNINSIPSNLNKEITSNKNITGTKILSEFWTTTFKNFPNNQTNKFKYSKPNYTSLVNFQEKAVEDKENISLNRIKIRPMTSHLGKVSKSNRFNKIVKVVPHEYSFSTTSEI
jgi:hypothetical protein